MIEEIEHMMCCYSLIKRHIMKYTIHMHNKNQEKMEAHFDAPPTKH